MELSTQLFSSVLPHAAVDLQQHQSGLLIFAPKRAKASRTGTRISLLYAVKAADAPRRTIYESIAPEGFDYWHQQTSKTFTQLQADCQRCFEPAY